MLVVIGRPKFYSENFAILRHKINLDIKNFETINQKISKYLKKIINNNVLDLIMCSNLKLRFTIIFIVPM